jgi:Brp/Blh family beta-carotene 15,15'-monooxygenase
MIHQNQLYKFLSLIAAVTAILLEVTLPELANQIKYPALALCLVVIGIPHGSIDHIVTAKVYNLRYTLRDQLPFYLYYFAMMIAMAVVWIISPTAGLLFFLGITIYHFGQADLEHLNLSAIPKRMLFLSRGAMIMGLVLFSDLSYTGPVIQDITGLEILSSEFVQNYSFQINLFFVLQYLLMQTGLISVSNEMNRNEFLNLSIDSVLLAVLFWIVNPILAFSIYFGLWHSLGHVREMLDFFQQVGSPMSMKSFFIKSLPLTLITFAGMALMYGLIQAVNIGVSIISLLFIIISVLTLPHMLIVEKMYSVKQTAD